MTARVVALASIGRPRVERFQERDQIALLEPGKPE
jgi:hypothetical protein